MCEELHFPFLVTFIQLRLLVYILYLLSVYTLILHHFLTSFFEAFREIHLWKTKTENWARERKCKKKRNHGVQQPVRIRPAI